MLYSSYYNNCSILIFFYSIFGYQDDAADDIIYINWLNMVRAGLVGLEFYTPENNKWRQVSNACVCV